MKNIKTLLTFLSVLIVTIGALLIFQQLNTYTNTEQTVVIDQPQETFESSDANLTTNK